MQIYIKSLDGKNIALDVKECDTIEIIKKKYQEKTNFPYDNQLLIYNKEFLDDDKTLTELEIKNNYTLFFVIKSLTPKYYYEKNDEKN